MFSADSKLVEFFHTHRPPEQPIEQMHSATLLHGVTLLRFKLAPYLDEDDKDEALPNSLKGPKIILSMAIHHISKDGSFRILGNALTYLLSDFFGITFLHFLS